jgi:surface antigen
MHTCSRFARSFAAAIVLGGAVLAAIPLNIYGEPPPWAPAHGWRKKNDPYYAGYTGKKWEKDYGVVEGRCNRQEVGAVLGAVAGGAVGSQVGRGTGRNIAIVVGTIAGAVIGAQIGREMDRTDYACMGHTLELSGDNRRVSWASADNRTSYLLTPLSGVQRNGQTCREFNLRATRGGRHEDGRGIACRTGDGTWQIVR